MWSGEYRCGGTNTRAAVCPGETVARQWPQRPRDEGEPVQPDLELMLEDAH
jgi:hypothetical protein